MDSLEDRIIILRDNRKSLQLSVCVSFNTFTVTGGTGKQ